MQGMSQEELLEVLEDNKADGGHIPHISSAELTEQKQGDKDSWKELYRVLITSLGHSSSQFQALSFEALTLGLWGLSSTHAMLRDDIAGRRIGVDDRAVIKEFIYFGEWSRAFEAGKTATELASALHIQESCVLIYQPLSQPMLPAHLLAVDHPHQQLLLVVRGTTQLADALTDLLAHTVPLGHGQAHSGMLECTVALIQLCLPPLEQQFKQHAGYRLHCIGHSLGGGVAALVAYLLRNTQEWRRRLSAAGCAGVMATGFGTPPVMTQELAECASSYTRTLVHNHDLVPRTCIASLAVLRQQLEEHKEAAFANNATMSWLRESGVVEGGKTLLSSVVTYAAANTTATKVASVITRSAGMQRFVAAGLQVGASLLANKLKELHTDAMTGPSGAVSGIAAAHSSSEAAATAATVKDSTTSTAHVAAAHGDTATAAGTSTANSMWGGFSALQRAAAAAAGGATNFEQQQHVPAQKVKSTVPIASSSEAEQQQVTTGAVALAAMNQQQKVEEVQAAAVMLYCPGQLFHLKRTGEDAEALYELICRGIGTDNGGSRNARFGKIIVNRSMLRDHYLTHYITGLHKLELQLLEDTPHCN